MASLFDMTPLNTKEQLDKRESASSSGLTSVSLIARNAALNLFSEAWVFIVLIIAMPKLVKLLGEASFGLFSLAWVIIGYLTVLDIGVSRAATKFVSEHLADRDFDSTRAIVQTSVIANLLLGLLGGSAVALVSPVLVHSVFKVRPGLEAEAQLVFFAAALAVPVLLLQGIFRGVLSSFQRFGWITGVNTVATTVQWGLACVLAKSGYAVAVVVFSTVFVRVLTAAAYGAVVKHLLPELRVFRRPDLAGLSKLLRFGSWVTVSQLVSPLLVYMDRVLIASFVSLEAVTLYTVPFELITRLRIVPTSLVGTLYPAFSERGAAGREQQLQRLFEGSVRFLLMMMLPGVLFLVLLGPDVLGIWMGRQFSQNTSAILQILGIGTLLNCMANIPYYAIQALGRPDIPGKLHLIELPFYAVLCALLIPRWGITGAALANSIRVSIDAILLFWGSARYCRCSIKGLCQKPGVRILVANTIIAFVLLGARSQIASAWGRIGIGVVAMALYLLFVWCFLLERDEKPQIGKALRFVTT